MKIRKNFKFTFQKILLNLLFDLLLTEEKDQSHYVLIKDFGAIICNQTLHQNRKNICCCCFR